MIGGPPSAAKSAVVRELTARVPHADVIDTDLPASSLGDFRAAIRARPCHVIVLGDAGTPRVGLWLEVSGRTPEETVDEILAQASTDRSPIVVTEYDENWPRRFEEHAEPIRALGYRVEHVGSTSVPGLAAKPVVDIDVVVNASDEVPAAIEALRSLGYVYQGDKGIAGREAFLWPPGARPHHVYVVVDGSPPYLDHVDFRDYLRNHPETCEDYAALKIELAQRHVEDRLGYTEAKAEFVTGVLRAARR